MKKQKVERKIVYDGLGFPVILRNVPMMDYSHSVQSFEFDVPTDLVAV